MAALKLIKAAIFPKIAFLRQQFFKIKVGLNNLLSCPFQRFN